MDGWIDGWVCYLMNQIKYYQNDICTLLQWGFEIQILGFWECMYGYIHKCGLVYFALICFVGPGWVGLGWYTLLYLCTIYIYIYIYMRRANQ